MVWIAMGLQRSSWVRTSEQMISASTHKDESRKKYYVENLLIFLALNRTIYDTGFDLRKDLVAHRLDYGNRDAPK
jgi:hypothetical protein